MNYARVYCDDEGETHFEDASVEMMPRDFSPPAPPVQLAAPIDSQKTILFFAPEHWFGEWHHTPRRQFCVVVSGELEIQVSDGEIRRFVAGGLSLLEDTSSKGHTTRILGGSGAELVLIQLSGEDGEDGEDGEAV